MIHIFVVDDHPMIRDCICMAIKSQVDMSVAASAENGREALALINSGVEVDLVLTDLHMPVMNGYELTKELSLRYPNLPVIVFSSDRLPNVKEELAQAGAKAFVSKEENISVLISTLRNICLS